MGRPSVGNALMANEKLVEALAHVEELMEQVLALQTRTDRGVSELRTGLLSTRPDTAHNSAGRTDSLLGCRPSTQENDGGGDAVGKATTMLELESPESGKVDALGEAGQEQVGWRATTGSEKPAPVSERTGDRSQPGSEKVPRAGTLRFSRDKDTDKRLDKAHTAVFADRLGSDASATPESTLTPSRNVPLAPGFGRHDSFDQQETSSRVDKLLDFGCELDLDGGQTQRSASRAWKFMMDPHGTTRVTHDTFGLAVLIGDTISIPLVLAWDLPEVGFLLALRVFTLLFWSTDVALNFLTSFYFQGELEVRPSLVAKRYFKTWFIPEISVVVADVVSLCLGAFGVLGWTSKVLRLFRLVRMVRASDIIARLAKAGGAFEVVADTIKPLAAIILTSHVLACVWWSVSSNLPSDTGLRWMYMQYSNDVELTFMQERWSFQYLTCTHWTISQLTLGSMDVLPLNSVERAFTCIYLLVGIFGFSTIISALSTKMMRYYMKQHDRITKISSLRRFLAHRVHTGISIAAQFQAEKMLSSTTGKPVTMKDVEAIPLLTQALRRKIHVELCAKHLTHPLFRWWSLIDCEGLRVLCYKAIDFVGLAPEDTLFFPRASASGAYIVVSGAMDYVGSAGPHELLNQQVRQGQFLCETALWCKWKHVGELTATTGSELLSISASGLFTSLEADQAVKHVVVQYGRQFHQRLTAPSLGEGQGQPNDLTVPFTEFDSILPALPTTCRQLIGAVAVCIARQKSGRKSFLPGKQLLESSLEDSQVREVRQGKGCLMVNSAGNVDRIVALIVFRLMRDDGRALMQVAEWGQDRFRASCKLPGKKLGDGMGTMDALENMLRSSAFAPFMHGFTFGAVELETTWKESKRMSVTTKYLKTVSTATLTCPPEDLALEATRVLLTQHSCAAPGVRRGTSSESMQSFNLKGSKAPETIWDSPSFQDGIETFVVVDAAGNLLLVSWLTPEDQRRLTTADGDDALQDLLTHLVVGPSLVELAMERLAVAQEEDKSESGSEEAPGLKVNQSEDLGIHFLRGTCLEQV